MPAGNKTLDYKVNQDSQLIVDNDLGTFSGTVQLFRGEKIIFTFSVVDSANAPIDFTGDTFLLGIKNPNDMGGVELASSTDSSGSTLAAGIVKITIDLNTAEMNTFVNYQTSPNGLKMELSAISGGVEQRLVFQSDATIKTDANQLITSNVTLIGSTTPVLMLNPDAKLDATAIAQTTIFTVPADTVFIPLKLHLLVTDITGAAVAPTVQFGTTSTPALLLSPDVTVANGQYEIEVWDITGIEAVPAGEVLEFGITVASTATTEEIIPALEGYLLSV